MKIFNAILICYFFAFFANAKAPNFLLVYLDDDKFAGQDFSEQLPNIKALESKALSLSNFYASTPHEVAIELLSGKYPVNIKNVPILDDMQADEACVAKSLKQEGYASAYIGKWRNSKAIYPSGLGFDLFLGILDSDFKWPYEWQLKNAKSGKMKEDAIKAANLSLMMNSNIIEMPFLQRKLITTFTEETINFILDSKKQLKPFFIYLNYASSYAPELALKMFFPDTEKSRIAKHHSAIDASMGKILTSLERNALLDNTMIIFISKAALNAKPLTKLMQNNAYLDSFCKRSAFVYMPKLFKEAKALDGIVSTLDMPAFILDCAKGADGKNSMLGYFLGKHACDESPILYYGYTKYALAMRDENYKVIVERPQMKIPLQLFDLDKDPEEKHNLAESMPDKAKALLQQARYLDSQQPKVYSKQEIEKMEAIANKKAKEAKLKAEKEAKKKAEAKLKAEKEGKKKAKNNN